MGRRRNRPLTSSGTLTVSVVLAGITHDACQDRELQNQAGLYEPLML
jgi:hypothetical protein